MAGKIRPEQLGTAAAITSLLNAADATAARTALGLGELATKATAGYADLSVTVGGRNLLPNSSFEQALTGWWVNAVDSCAVSTERALVGAQSLKLVETTVGADSFAVVSIAAKPSTTYTASAWLYVESITAAAIDNRAMMVMDTPFTTSPTDFSLSTDHPVGVWTRKVLRITTGASATALNVRLYCPQGTVYWDCVQLEEGDVPTAWRPYTSDAAMALLNAADAAGARTVLGVPSSAGDVFTGPIEVPGAALGWRTRGYSAAPIKYLIAELESADNPNSMARITIEGVLDSGWRATTQRPFRLDIATREGLRCFYSQGGEQIAETSIDIYLGTDSRYYVWLTVSGFYSASLFMRDAVAAVAHREPAQGTPNGTLVFSTATAAPRRTDYYTLKFSGTSAATQGGTVTFAHGLSDIQKIKSVSVIAHDGAGAIISANLPAQFNVSFIWWVDSRNVFVHNVDGSSSNMLSRPIYITIEVWY